MSAWVVSKGHIDVLVNACAEYGILRGDPRTLGQDLWRENVRSVNCRYGERTRAAGYQSVTTEAPLHPLAVLKAISCYQYQTCERPDWPKSGAFRVTEALRAAILDRHPAYAELVPSRYGTGYADTFAYTQLPLYDAMPWGFDSLADAEAHRYVNADRA